MKSKVLKQTIFYNDTPTTVMRCDGTIIREDLEYVWLTSAVTGNEVQIPKGRIVRRETTGC